MHPNIDFKDVYFHVSNFLYSMLFTCKYEIDAYIPNYSTFNSVSQKYDSDVNFYYILFNNKWLTEQTKHKAYILHKTKFELTNQKDTLHKHPEIFLIVMLLVETLMIFDTDFDLQYAAFMLIKRLFIEFPEHRAKLEEQILQPVANLIAFSDSRTRAIYLKEAREFLNYALENVSEKAKEKIIKRIQQKNIDMSVDPDLVARKVESEDLALRDFNLRVGFPCAVTVEASSEYRVVIDVTYPNSLIYLGLALEANDITVKILRYRTDVIEKVYDKSAYYENVFEVEKIDLTEEPLKIVNFVEQPGTYVFVFDNSYSWLTSKKVRFRISVLRPTQEIDVYRHVTEEELLPKVDKNRADTDPDSVELLTVDIHKKEKYFEVRKINQREKEMKMQEGTQLLNLTVICDGENIQLFRNLNLNYKIDSNTPPKERFVKVEVGENMGESVESAIINLLDEVPNFADITMFINFFTLKAINCDLTVARKEEIEETFGFFPAKLVEMKNCHLFFGNLVENMLLYSLYERTLDSEEINTIVHVNIGKSKILGVMYFKGAIEEQNLEKECDELTVEAKTEIVSNYVKEVSLAADSLDICLSKTEIPEEFTVK